MQQSKVLTSGEGGAVITADADLYTRLQQLRADGRCYAVHRALGDSELEVAGDVQGHNYCLSEFQSAILLDRLRRLDEENATRLKNAEHLTHRLQIIKGVWSLHDLKAEARPTFYRYCLGFDLERLGHVPIEILAAALTAELKLPIQPLYEPLNQNKMFDPRRSPRRQQTLEVKHIFDPSRFFLPIATAARRQYVGIPHNALLGGTAETEDVALAVEKVINCWRDLADVSGLLEANRDKQTCYRRSNALVQRSRDGGQC
jgi:L-glutamine:scyllo-inosose aminotransferase/L-glutamine:2-deoxy-scyllo-inosose/3-amino-2,3-dideoxy-scyllo-inosose aminotransferase